VRRYEVLSWRGPIFDAWTTQDGKKVSEISANISPCRNVKIAPKKKGNADPFLCNAIRTIRPLRVMIITKPIDISSGRSIDK